MNKNILSKNYEVINFKIDRNNINEFGIMENRRQVSDSQVSQISGALNQGKNPIGVLIVNFRDGKYRLIDGNHRVEAIKKFLSYKPKNEEIVIECILKVYKNLTDEEERQIYSDEAKRRNESYEDRLNLYKDTLQFWKLLQDRLNSFPCRVSIYNTKDGLKFRNVLNALYTVKLSNKKGFVTGNLKKEEMVRFANELNYDDFVFLKDFMEFFQQIFGKIGTENKYTKVQFFCPLIDIYAKNISRKKEKDFNRRFETLIGRTDILTYMNTAGKEWKIKIRELMIGYMNHGISARKFI